MSDVHGNLLALEAVLADGKDRGVDLWVCAGDLVNYGPRPVEAVSAVRDVASLCVKGNRDLECVLGDESRIVVPEGRDADVEKEAFRWTLGRMDRRSLEYLASLPIRAALGRLALFHASPWSPYQYLRAEDVASTASSIVGALDAMVYCFGHTHVPYVHCRLGRVFINAGSCGKPKDGDPRASYAVVDLDAETSDSAAVSGRHGAGVRAEIVRVAYDARLVAEEMVRFGLPDSLAAAIISGREAQRSSAATHQSH